MSRRRQPGSRVVRKRHRRRDFSLPPKRRRRPFLRIKRSLRRIDLILILATLFIIGIATAWQPLTALRNLGFDLSFINTSFLHFPDETVDGEVTRVLDGDTIEVRGVGRVRLHEIDAPEKGQPYSQSARGALANKIAGKQVRVEVFETDRYGRKVGKIWLDERGINRELVREGFAWAYRQHLQDGSLLSDERAAREAGIGLWADKREPIPPWEWRKGAR